MTKRKKFFGKLFVSVWFSLVAFHSYWREFDGAYTGMDLLWGGVVAVTLGMAIFAYFPIAHKIEHFSLAWFLVLFIVLGLLSFGWVLSGVFHLPLLYRAWGEYILWIGLVIPWVHQIFHYAGKPRQKGSFFKRIRLKPTESAQA